MFKKKVRILFSFIIFFSVSIFANPFVDVYGTDEETANKIIEKFGDDIHKTSQRIVSLAAENLSGSNPEDLIKSKKKIILGINKIKAFHSISFSPVYYQDARVFTTVNVIEKNDYKKLTFFKNFKQKKHNKVKIKQDKQLDTLLSQWTAYEETGHALFRKGIQLGDPKSCGFYHYTYGFENAQLKPYKKIFQREVAKNKQKLIKILHLDPDEDRRANAVFLLGHIKNGSELIRILTPSMLDPSEYVRNNVMRVLGSTLLIVNQADFDILPVIKMLDSPAFNDRNKSLFMLIGLSNDPQHRRSIIENGDKALIAALKMKQPNLHDNVYKLLQKISIQNYDERDYNAWQNWLDQEKVKQQC